MTPTPPSDLPSRLREMAAHLERHYGGMFQAQVVLLRDAASALASPPRFQAARTTQDASAGPEPLSASARATRPSVPNGADSGALSSALASQEAERTKFLRAIEQCTCGALGDLRVHVTKGSEQ